MYVGGFQIYTSDETYAGLAANIFILADLVNVAGREETVYFGSHFEDRLWLQDCGQVLSTSGSGFGTRSWSA